MSIGEMISEAIRGESPARHRPVAGAVVKTPGKKRRRARAAQAAKLASSWDLTADWAQARFHRDTGRYAKFVFPRAGGFVAC